MAFVPVQNCIEVIAYWTYGGQLCENTYYYKYQAGALPTLQQLQDLLVNFRTNILPHIADINSDQVNYYRLTARNLSYAGSVQAEYQITPVLAGSRHGVAPDGNVVIGIRRKTGITGKSYRGRIEVQAGAGSDTEKNVASTAYYYAVAGVLIYLLLPLIGPDAYRVAPALASRKRQQADTLVAWVVDTFTDSQKTRLAGHGT